MKLLWIVGILVVCLLPPALAGNDRLEVTVSMNQRSTDAGDSRNYNWSMGGKWSDQWGTHDTSLEVQSDYSRDDGAATYDRLKTWWRYSLGGPTGRAWKPLVLFSTEGPHDCEQLYTLGALGLHRDFKGGFLELSAGASKDVRTSASWTGDIGALVKFDRRWGKFGWSVTPQGNFGAVGEARRRGDRFLYTLDTSLDYRFSGSFGVSYRFQVGNTLVDANRIEYLGLKYTH